MWALPPGFGTARQDHVTGIACPSCPGVLEVRVEGAEAYIRFKCRIGHTFSLEELLAAKEGCIEDCLWACITAFDEFAQILKDLEREAAPAPAAAARYRERRDRVLAHARTIRQLIESNDPIALSTEVDPETESGATNP